MNFVDELKIPNSIYPQLSAVLHVFVDKISGCLKDKLIGVYLVGSIASGDFDLDSDIDFLVVIDQALTQAEMQSLQTIQAEVYEIDAYPAKHLEGSTINLKDLSDWETVGKKPLFYFDNGSTQYELSTHDNQWHVRWILRERGLTLIGPDPKTLLPPIPIVKLLAESKSTMYMIIEYFQNEITKPLNFSNSRFGQSFFVLTTCRILHTLQTGTVQSKKAGKHWAVQNLPPDWLPLINQAWEERIGVRFGLKIGQHADPALLEKTLAFMNYALSQIDK